MATTPKARVVAALALLRPKAWENVGRWGIQVTRADGAVAMLTSLQATPAKAWASAAAALDRDGAAHLLRLGGF